VSLQELHRRCEIRFGAFRVFSPALQGLSLLDRRRGGPAVAVGRERDEPRGGETIAHALEEGGQSPPGV
jgi:hypothetical protein